MRQLSQTDPEWGGKSLDQKYLEASTKAMEELRAEADRKVANAHLQIIKTAATEQRVQDAAKHTSTRTAALVHVVDHAGDYVAGVKQEAMGGLMNLLDAVKSGEGASPGRRVAMFLFDVRNPKMTLDLAREIFAGAEGKTGNKVATAGAKAWLDTIESMRQRFNAAGGDIGKLLYGYLPQPHDAARVRAAGRDVWVSKILPALDRSKMVDENGVPLNDAAARDMLAKVWDTIQSEGLNQMQPGEMKGGASARANHGLEHRELHFKDAEGYLGYLNEFGRGSMYDAMVSHVGRMARDIGLVEQFGPNPNAQMQLQFELAAKADGRQVNDLPRTMGVRPQSIWDTVNGAASAPQSARIAQVGTDVRNVMTAGKLAGAVLASITDVGTYFATTHFNKLSYWDAAANIGKLAASKETRRFLTAHGIIAESMMGDLNRWTSDNIKATWSGRIAQSVLKLSLMNAWTDTLRRAFSLTMMQGMARLAGKDWEALGEWDRGHMERKGITADDWSVIRKAELTNFQGVDHLTPESIHATGDPRANEVVSKVLGLIQDESEFAVLNPDVVTKTIASGGARQRGTVGGELARSVMQFKSFPIAMVSRHWNRMLDMPHVSDGSAPAGLGGPTLTNRLAYGGAVLVSTTILGAIALQAKQVVTGRDPIDPRGPHATKFWLKAMAQGGGLSIVGDMVLNDPGNSPADFIRSTTGTIVGPAISTAAQAAAIPIAEGWKKAKGKPTKAGADLVGLARQNAPYVNLWYAKAALDHMGMHALQENLSPGYLARMQQQSQQDWGQGFWWKPGTGGPQRAPNFAKAVGQ